MLHLIFPLSKSPWPLRLQDPLDSPSHQDPLDSPSPQSSPPSPQVVYSTDSPDSASDSGFKFKDVELLVSGEKIKVRNVPSQYTVVYQRTHTLYKESHEELQKIKKNLDKSRYDATPTGKTFLGKSLAIMPKASHDILQSTIPILWAAFCSNIGLTMVMSKLAQIAPRRKAISKTVADYAASSYVRVLIILQRNPYAYLLADKAKSGKKGSQSATLPKINSFTNPDTRHIEKFLLDVNSAGENSEAVAGAIIHALTQLGLIDPDLLLNIMGHTTDSGDSGTLFALERCLRKLDMPGMIIAYMVGACCLHNFQTALHTAIIEVFGEGGIDKETYE